MAEMKADTCSVRVAVRIRPLIKLESDKGCGEAIHAVPGKPQVLAGEKGFTLDYAYGPRTPQTTLYDDLAKPLLRQVFKGCVCLPRAVPSLYVRGGGGGCRGSPESCTHDSCAGGRGHHHPSFPQSSHTHARPPPPSPASPSRLTHARDLTPPRSPNRLPHSWRRASSPLLWTGAKTLP